jgi:hypothetical protein
MRYLFIIFLTFNSYQCNADVIDTNTNALNALTNVIPNAGGSQDNTDLVNSLDGLSNSIDNVVSSDESNVVNAIGDLEGEVESNTEVLNNLSDFINDDDSSGEIDNKSTGLFSNLSSYLGASPSFSSSNVNCPIFAFNENALLVGGLVIDSHCSLAESIRSYLRIIMLAYFSIMGFRTVFSA